SSRDTCTRRMFGALAAGPPAGDTEGATGGAAAVWPRRTRGERAAFTGLYLVGIGTESASIDHDLPRHHSDGPVGEAPGRPVHAVLPGLIPLEVGGVIRHQPPEGADLLGHERP